METILDAAIQYVEKPTQMKQWIRSWLQVIGCSPRLRSKYSTETSSPSNSPNEAHPFSEQVDPMDETPCSIEHSMHALCDRFLHPSAIGADVSLIDDINEAFTASYSCNRPTHFAYLSVLFLLKRKIEQPDSFIADWLDYVLKGSEEKVTQAMKIKDYFRSDNTQVEKENHWVDTLRYALPQIVPILTIPEVCLLRKRLFSRLRKIGCWIASPQIKRRSIG